MVSSFIAWELERAEAAKEHDGEEIPVSGRPTGRKDRNRIRFRRMATPRSRGRRVA